MKSLVVAAEAQSGAVAGG